MNTSTVRVAIYARISEDVTGEGAGVERQIQDARDLARLNDWKIVAEFQDNDVSALKGRARPGYEALLDAVKTGQVDHVLVWQLSRLFRNRVERATAIGLLGSARVGIKTVKGQDLDLSTASGRAMAGLLGEFDTMESEVKSERVAAAAAHRARSGVPNGGLGYGWTRRADGTYVENHAQAAIVREVVRRLLGGESLRGVTADLNSRGVPAPNSPAWGSTSVKKLALRWSNVAIRVHHRGKPDETFTDGKWPALVDRADHDAVTRLLSASSRRTNGPSRPGARKHLLSWGIGECGECGGRLRVALRGSSTYGKKAYLYVCDEKQCVGRNQSKVDQMVRALMIQRLSLPDTLDHLRADSGALQEAARNEAMLAGRLDDTAAAFAKGQLTMSQLTRVTAEIRPQLDQATAEHQRLLEGTDLEALVAMAGPRSAQLWDEAPVAARRMATSKMIETVVINRAIKRGPGFNPDDVVIKWRSAQV